MRGRFKRLTAGGRTGKIPLNLNKEILAITLVVNSFFLKRLME
jgi:hypothetical protein